MLSVYISINNCDAFELHGYFHWHILMHTHILENKTYILTKEINDRYPNNDKSLFLQ